MNEQWRPASEPPPVFLAGAEWYRSNPVLGYSLTGQIQVVTYEQYDRDEPFYWYTNCSEHWNLGAGISHWMPLPPPP